MLERVWVKRDDLCFDKVPLSKARGAVPHITARPEPTIVCLDTYRSLNGLITAAVAHALGKRSILYFPQYVAAPEYIAPHHQRAHAEFGAELRVTPATRQGVMESRVKRALLPGEYLMPKAFKLAETSHEVGLEYQRTVESLGWRPDTLVVPVGTGTHLRGLTSVTREERVVAVLGYARPTAQLRAYAGWRFDIVESTLDYRDADDYPAPFPASPFYEAKAWRWTVNNAPQLQGRTLFWNMGA